MERPKALGVGPAHVIVPQAYVHLVVPLLTASSRAAASPSEAVPTTPLYARPPSGVAASGAPARPRSAERQRWHGRRQGRRLPRRRFALRSGRRRRFGLRPCAPFRRRSERCAGAADGEPTLTMSINACRPAFAGVHWPASRIRCRSDANLLTSAACSSSQVIAPDMQKSILSEFSQRGRYRACLPEMGSAA
jgi:hypothetical protein